jgi:hypothetical protein
MATNFLKPGYVLAHSAVVGRSREVRIEERPERSLSIGAALVGEPVVGVAGLALLGAETRVLQQAKVAGDPGLGDSENARQLAHVESVLRKDPEESEPGPVSEQAEEF